MRRTSVFVLSLALGGLLVGGCSPGEETSATAGNPEQLAQLRTAKEQLDQKRQRLAELRQSLGEAQGAGEETQIADLEAQVKTLEEEVANESEQFGGQLVGYINSLEIEQGAPLTPEQQEAMRMKSDEDIELGREWIEKGGDYRRAIEIYDTALLWDPDNPRLHEAKASAESMRYMTQERFDQVEKGMTQQQVRNLLGPVNLRNKKEYPDENVEAWFYPKEDGSASGVWFRPAKSGDGMTVYQLNFDVRAEEGGAS